MDSSGGAPSPRERLPNRRAQITDNVRWPLDGGRRIHVSAGLTPDGRILETFLRGGGRVGSEVDFLLDDVAVLISRLLQHGDTLGAIASGLGRLSTGEPASVVAAVVDRLLEIERGDG
ncbi:MAG TPA: ribonucleotide reductase [Stellaceae bacterium]|nr:ribonucleotide reductase [Stellaceae bacterium]